MATACRTSPTGEQTAQLHTLVHLSATSWRAFDSGVSRTNLAKVDPDGECTNPLLFGRGPCGARQFATRIKYDTGGEFQCKTLEVTGLWQGFELWHRFVLWGTFAGGG